VKTLAILTNGGDTCALNASIKSIRDSAYRVGYKKIYGIRRGYQGLVDASIDDITHREIDVRIGGSCLGSLRVSPTDRHESKGPGGTPIVNHPINDQRCRRMARCLADYRIDVLVVIGGDGTLQATKKFQDWVHQHRTQDIRPFDILGFLKTIDNDIRTFTNFKGIEVSLCPGFPSAVKKIVSAVEDLRVTARTAERAFSVETMGRDAGWLAAAGTYGGAEILLVPELIKLYRTGSSGHGDVGSSKEASSALLKDLVDEIVSFYQKNRNVLIAVAEGFELDVDVSGVKEFQTVIHDLYGTRKKVGATELVAMLVSPVLRLFFKCLSGFCQSEADVAALSDRVKRVLESTMESDEGKRYTEVVAKPSEGEHPLTDWDLEERLLGSVSAQPEPGAPPPAEGGATEPTGGAPGSDAATGGGSQGTATAEPAKSPVTIPPYNFEIRPHRTDYVPRSGQPSSYDYRLATLLGRKLGEMLSESQFGMVPCLKEVVPYDELGSRGGENIEPIAIGSIRTQTFSSMDYFFTEKRHGADRITRLQVSDIITRFFRTITTGPDNLEQAILDEERLGRRDGEGRRTT
jgi:6-phosphofructokinase